ncbi:hypothetical protein [Gymnodinialimonas hymeniacidonis]|uniref:hypothetical protein n=1 Tax=Gymnodinialimonas hymeniacidonis TaxID=3126508 RepID=UPI0034C6596C
MRPWIVTSAVSHAVIGLIFGLASIAIFYGWATPVEAMVLYLIVMAALVAFTQARLVTRLGVSGRRWGLATALGIALGFVLPELLPSYSPSSEPRTLFHILPSALFFGLACGTAQWVLSHPRTDPRRWIPLSVAGWSLLLISVAAGAQIITRQCLLPVEGAAAWPLWAGLALASLCGALGGASYGALTAPALPAPRA